MDDFGLMVGRYYTTLPTLSDTQVSEVMLDDKGRLIISGRYLEDSAHTSGDAGIFTLAVANHTEGAMHSADGDYAPLQVDASGRLRVIADIDINGLPSEKLEDSAHSSGDSGMYVLTVRQDTLATDTSADGDYASFKVNALGELYVKDTDALSKLTEIDTVLDNIKIDTAAMVVDLAAIEAELLDQGTTLDAMAVDLAAIEAELLDQGTTLDSILSDTNAMVIDLAAIEAELLDQGTTLDNMETSIDNIEADIDAITKVEDSAHSSGDSGFMPLAVRKDTEGSLVDTDGDYAPFQVDADGKLRVAAEVAAPGSEQFTVTDALAGGGDGLATITAAATPWVTVASYAHTSGTAYIYGYQWACDQNAQVRLVTDVSSTITYYKTGVNSSAQPGDSEHFAGEGRIEIAGVANQEIRLQIKKRNATGGDANGTGSIHIRTVS